jgi:hypothetical protein
MPGRIVQRCEIFGLLGRITQGDCHLVVMHRPVHDLIGVAVYGMMPMSFTVLGRSLRRSTTNFLSPMVRSILQLMIAIFWHGIQPIYECFILEASNAVSFLRSKSERGEASRVFPLSLFRCE